MQRSQSLAHKKILPYSDDFPEALRSYCSQMEEAIRRNKHHDHRRSLLINFLRQGMGLDPVEFELEKKIQAYKVRGLIDAFFKQLIIEVKTDLDRERADAETELKKYFESQAHPLDYSGLVTDGLRFEVYIYEKRTVRQIRVFSLDPEAPLVSFRHLDQLFFTAKLLIPSPGDIVDRFGLHSGAYNAFRRSLEEAYDGVQEESAVKVKFREWNALLSKVYGSEIGDITLFITHTYLAMLSRAIVAMALFPTVRRNLKMYRGIVDGVFFRQKKLVNLAEPDFFSWALGTKAEQTLLENIEHLFSCLDIYNFDKLDGDILKELYQGLVDPQSRHDLGEYYTPDWLAELVIKEIGYKGGRLLDPSCGSGSFLYAAARQLRKTAKMTKTKLVEALTQDIVGIDVHPVAVLMAKANLLLSLKEEISGYPGEINLQVYMADTLMTGEDKEQNNLVIPVSDNHETFHIPFETIDRGAGALDELIDTLCEFSIRGSESVQKEKLAFDGLRGKLQKGRFSPNEIFYWQQNFRLLLKLEREKRNTVWAYILKNSYRPSYLRRDKVDYVVGNPPWLSYRYISNPTYKVRVKNLTFEHNLLEKTARNLFTQMDTSTVFFAHCQRDFLKPKGIMAFVMPKTAMLPAKQHLRFQRMGFSCILDFSDVKPLFNVRSCVLIRGKTPKIVAIPCKIYHADFKGERNLTLSAASMMLSHTKNKHDFLTSDIQYSPYHARFLQGATLVPRCFWFVEHEDILGANIQTPFLRTSREAYENAKSPWTIQIEGQIEKEFLFGTVLAKDLLPFVVHHLSLVILPLSVASGKSLHIINSEQALADGYVHAYDWFQNVQNIWLSKRKDKSYTVFQWLNYDNKLTQQSLKSNFTILYNKSGTNISASLVSKKEAENIGPFKIRGFVADMVTYWFKTDSEEEAHYLVGILNSEIVNDVIKPFQTQGLQGERDIHRRPFEACNIPLFDQNNKKHLRIAELSRDCRKRLLPIVSRMKAPVAKMRSEARNHVSGILKKIDEEVISLLAGSHYQINSDARSVEEQRALF
ncbi:MAG TPA: N-6 DNA methylase [Candidatus Hydrogenedentes bacterium]|nr:N-6 DNA methylase [Candidatus Hydrogenedentota bacterium]